MKFVQLLFILLIFTIPIGVVFRLTIAPNFHVYPIDIISSLFFVTAIPFLLRSKKILNKKLLILNCLFIAVGLISLLINSQTLSIGSFLTSLAYLFRYITYSSIIFILPHLPLEFVEKTPAKLMLAGLTFVLAGFLQYIYYPNLRNLYYLGWDEHLGRLFSTFLDPNFAGTLISLVFVLSAGILYETYKVDKKIDVFSGITSILSLLGVFLSQSRSAIVLLMVAGVSFLVIQKLYKQAIVFIAILIFGIFIFADFKYEGSNPFRVASGLARMNEINSAITIISKSPIIGVGFNAYRYAQVRFGTRSGVVEISNSDAGTDNSYLFVLATTGIIGGIIFLDFWLNILRRLYIMPVVFASVVGLLVNTLFINSIFYPFIMVWIFTLIGVTLSRKR